ncbi:MAG: hypothetical protein IPL88_09215 [Rhizobiales bacterium]|nr:hypothetical protein [Hyphomicrobiales bacterium]
MPQASQTRWRHRRATRRGFALDFTCARIGQLLDAPRAPREETSQSRADAPSVVELVLRGRRESEAA